MQLTQQQNQEVGVVDEDTQHHTRDNQMLDEDPHRQAFETAQYKREEHYKIYYNARECLNR